ncbi:hypothetical protein NM208_g12450 [Fusarium decemcellulare]|uniref:Uncharacterized protein n=1 Tax=Fusarium decemcellulare TaxID=57161 RepID=A0ACC1RQM5_9HYPO|nr:hypothetical protein NM208_g12450 [Fusarium decemcellulare]
MPHSAGNPLKKFTAQGNDGIFSTHANEAGLADERERAPPSLTQSRPTNRRADRPAVSSLLRIEPRTVNQICCHGINGRWPLLIHAYAQSSSTHDLANAPPARTSLREFAIVSDRRFSPCLARQLPLIAMISSWLSSPWLNLTQLTSSATSLERHRDEGDQSRPGRRRSWTPSQQIATRLGLGAVALDGGGSFGCRRRRHFSRFSLVRPITPSLHNIPSLNSLLHAPRPAL